MGAETRSSVQRDEKAAMPLDSYPSLTPPPSKPASTRSDSITSQFEARTPLGVDLAELYSENVLAKAYRTATKTSSEPASFPEYVPQEGDHAGIYQHREPEFWTCGFFPGTLYGLLERLVRFPNHVSLPSSLDIDKARLRGEISRVCEQWSEPLHAMASRTDTHDVGFIIMPALRQSWELTGDARSLESIVRAAHSLASRYVPSASAIRSWDARIQKNIEITGVEDNLILIIDSMCNLDLLYYAASHCSGDAAGRNLYDVATAHASTLLRTHLRPEDTPSSVDSNSDVYRGQWYSTHHVANLDPATGGIKRQFTAQGFSDTSTWARGQAWGILGYAQTYMWTKDKRFLQASCGLAEYLIHRLETAPTAEAPFVPPWDLDAPFEDPRHPIRDSSAAAIAANGMLVLSQGLAGLGSHQLSARFRRYALNMARNLAGFAVAPEKAKFATTTETGIAVEDEVPTQTFEAILKFGTANNNVHAKKQYANHGLVYGDYYLVELGNRLLRMGLD